ncbi:5-(carboxyamino)imidazole ribonucleotide synthase [Thermococcus sp. MV5]|uniref:5-(carboxyamino)imidazole ribonucleotide synthase n=1 Tax=Thermococcus sp. MV5 TaxID=1638272 RepID=UPI001438C2B5|nr:5-(carboxyamino)imidazole ribonucleotide synthase [Thermococcus sp. MV5]NJE25943.1 5-(carboxyamino)imidazole ribonucleotide synthase [Thermococcus sp. MV5]
MNPTAFTIGILGGGQLAKMSAQEAKKLGFNVIVLDPTPSCPASMVAEQIVGRFDDADRIFELAERSDVLTYDIESVNVEALKQLVKEKPVIPSPKVLEIIQDKLIQKKVLKKAGVPVPWFKEIKSLDELENLVPVVQKARKGGYDGRGVVVLRSKEDFPKILKVPSYVEELVEIEKELAVIVVRDEDGNMEVYPVVEMIFNSRGNLLDMLLAPARIDVGISEEVQEIALKAVKALGGVGVFGVELFLAKDGRVLVNEIAPRPHNSGHYTIEACATSQFEQHIRVLTGLPLGSAELLTPAVMINLLGEEGYYGKPIYEGLKKGLEIPGVYVHIYGKRETFPFRKMGHVTIIDRSLDRAIEKARRLKSILKVRGERYEAVGRDNNG